MIINKMIINKSALVAYLIVISFIVIMVSIVAVIIHFTDWLEVPPPEIQPEQSPTQSYQNIR